MLISFLKSDDPSLLINVNQVVHCVFSISCRELKQEVPSFVIIDNILESRKPEINRVLLDTGEIILEPGTPDEWNSCESPEGLLYGKSHYDCRLGECVFERKGIYRERDVPTCKMTLYLSAVSASNEGTYPCCLNYTFYSIDDFLAAITALEEAMGGIRVVE